MKLKRLSCTSFLGLRQAEITWGDGVNVVFGPHAQGKTSLRDAITFALAGTCRGTDAAGRGAAALIRDDDQSAAVSVVVESQVEAWEAGEWIVARTAGSEGSTLSVVTPSNQTFSPQRSKEVLQQLRGCSVGLATACLNPERFLMAPRKEQNELLIEAACPILQPDHVLGVIKAYLSIPAAVREVENVIGIFMKTGPLNPAILGSMHGDYYTQRRDKKRDLSRLEGELQTAKRNLSEAESKARMADQSTTQTRLPIPDSGRKPEEIKTNMNAVAAELRTLSAKLIKLGPAAEEADRRVRETKATIEAIERGDTACPSIYRPQPCAYTQVSIEAARSKLPEMMAGLGELEKTREKAIKVKDAIQEQHGMIRKQVGLWEKELREAEQVIAVAEAVGIEKARQATDECGKAAVHVEAAQNRYLECANRVAVLEELVSALDPRQAPAGIVREAMTVANQHIGLIMEALGETDLRVTIDHDAEEGFALVAIRAGGKRRQMTMLSGYEKAIAALAIGSWMARSCEFNIVAVDEFTALTLARRRAIGHGLRAATGKLQVILFLAFDTRPGLDGEREYDDPVPFWVDGGRVYEFAQGRSSA